MNVRKWLTVSGTVILAMLVVLVLVVGLTRAQGPEPPEIDVEGEKSAAVIAPGAIPIQGRLTDDGGNPLNGTYTLTFRLYDVATDGTPLCSDTNSVSVENGLFSSYMDYCYNSVFGQKLYLGIEVGSDGEMTPRQVIYPVPYALSLVPGALISGTGDELLVIDNTSTSGGDIDTLILRNDSGTGEALEIAAQNTGVASFATDGYGVWGDSDNNYGVYGKGGTNFGVYGASDTNHGVAGKGLSAGTMGVYGFNENGGSAILGYSDSTTNMYPTLYLIQADSAGNFVVGASSLWGTRYWRVDRTGRGYFNGGTQVGGADFAEQMAVEGEGADYEPGDVLVISTNADRMVELSAEPFATAVIGVYSTKPAVLAGAPDTDDPLEGIPVAITGIVPCKVSAENGPIHRGDLLVTASTPGYAMRAGPNPPQGTVLGKALGELVEGTGVIHVLVTLQ
ncbi:MAG: hypothetical protein ISS49_00885 [Anaerolineae bacterium]|nr:hypothetical protein [Anaerolineae bacterium]